jgi:hypothetical protein
MNGRTPEIPIVSAGPTGPMAALKRVAGLVE